MKRTLMVALLGLMVYFWFMFILLVFFFSNITSSEIIQLFIMGSILICISIIGGKILNER